VAVAVAEAATEVVVAAEAATAVAAEAVVAIETAIINRSSAAMNHPRQGLDDFDEIFVGF